MQRRNMLAVDYAKKPPGGNRVGLHYSLFAPLSNQRARELPTGYAEKIFAPGSNPRSRANRLRLNNVHSDIRLRTSDFGFLSDFGRLGFRIWLSRPPMPSHAPCAML